MKTKVASAPRARMRGRSSHLPFLMFFSSAETRAGGRFCQRYEDESWVKKEEL